MNVVSVGLWTLIHREVLRFVRRPRNTFLPPAITNTLYFVVFGVILGGRINASEGVPYILFILPGLVVLGATSDAFQNASFSIFHGRWNEYIHEVQTSPLSYTEMVLAYVSTSALRGIIIAVLITIVGAICTNLIPSMTPVWFAHPAYVVAFILVITFLFAGFGVVGGLWARDFDYLTVMNQFIIRPLVFFGAVFYPLSALSKFWQTVSLLNPMVYMVDGVRYAFIGTSDIDPNVSLAVLTGATVMIVLFDVWLFKRGYGLTE
ncbi:ABC transporter permease [Halocatena marina]|uniref:ABC transporter permease n=1 Tax=Halocatena marina TaxID=2934937 RepID=A0ABD5YPM8_9EURY|nr:ABC transporter permease [Halocatena marina]